MVRSEHVKGTDSDEDLFRYTWSWWKRATLVRDWKFPVYGRPGNHPGSACPKHGAPPLLWRPSYHPAYASGSNPHRTRATLKESCRASERCRATCSLTCRSQVKGAPATRHAVQIAAPPAKAGYPCWSRIARDYTRVRNSHRRANNKASRTFFEGEGIRLRT